MTYDKMLCRISGEISNISLEYKRKGENFYSFLISSKRLSGVVDTIPCIAPESVLNAKENEMVSVSGIIRSRMSGDRLHVYLFAEKMSETKRYENRVVTDGTFCRLLGERPLGKGRKLACFMLAVDRGFKEAYIPCIIWGRNAERYKTLPKGTKVRLEGRFQSRDFMFHDEPRTAYEVSISSMEELKGDCNED